MKNFRMVLPVLAIAIALLSFRNPTVSSIKGKVSPASYAARAWAISKTDTLYTTISDGSFEFPNAKPGIYRIVVEAISPYRHLAQNNIVVRDNQQTDVELALQRY